MLDQIPESSENRIMKYRTIKVPPDKGSITLEQAVWAARVVSLEDDLKAIRSKRPQPQVSAKSHKGTSLAVQNGRTASKAKSARKKQ
jgi:hypothetical protein